MDSVLVLPVFRSCKDKIAEDEERYSRNKNKDKSAHDNKYLSVSNYLVLNIRIFVNESCTFVKNICKSQTIHL